VYRPPPPRGQQFFRAKPFSSSTAVNLHATCGSGFYKIMVSRYTRPRISPVRDFSGNPMCMI
jgi:hypothetical protein